MIEGTPEPDGRPVKLDVTILTTDPTTPRPGIVLAHGFNGTKDDSLEPARTLAEDGYAVIIYTARGFGASGGSIHLDHPDFEGADAVKIIDLAASRPEVARTGDDPVIGVAGASYGGCGVADRGRARSSGGRDRAGLHLQPAEPGAVPAVRGGGRARVAGRRHARRRTGGVQADAGPRCCSAAETRPRIHPARPRPATRSAVGSPPRCARAIWPWPSPAGPTRG